MGSVERYDFSRPPPGYFREPGTEFVRQGHGKRRTLTEAWARWKTRRDPPGMEVQAGASGQSWGWGPHNIVVGDRKHGQWFTGAASEEKARAAAWDWYLRRLAIVVALEFVGVTLDLWPAALLWTDEDCAAIDAWLRRGPSWLPDDFPDALYALGSRRPVGG